MCWGAVFGAVSYLAVQWATGQEVTAGGLVASTAAGALTGGISALSPILANMGSRGVQVLAVKAGIGMVIGQQAAVAKLAIDNDHNPQHAAAIPASGFVNGIAAIVPGGDLTAKTARGFLVAAGVDAVEGLVEEAASNLLEGAINTLDNVFGRGPR